MFHFRLFVLESFIGFFMPNVCCCVPGLIFHRLPKEEKIFDSWLRLIRDENLDPTTRDIKRICGMHFHGCNKSYPQLLQINTYPTFFPWKKSWDKIVQNYRSCKPSASETEISTAKEVNATLGKHVYGENELMATLVAAKPELSLAYIKASHNKTVSASSTCNHHQSVCHSTSSSPVITTSSSQPSCSYYTFTFLLHKNSNTPKEIAQCLKSGRFDNETLKQVCLKTVKYAVNCTEIIDSLNEMRSIERFGLQRFQGSDDEIRFWTGMYSYKSLTILYSMFEKHVLRIHYIGSGYSHTKSPESDKCGPKRLIQPMDELFLTLMRLKLGSLEQDLAERFRVSKSQVSRITNTWIDLLYRGFKSVDIWAPLFENGFNLTLG